jgi:hypothetical protein
MRERARALAATLVIDAADPGRRIRLAIPSAQKRDRESCRFR